LSPSLQRPTSFEQLNLQPDVQSALDRAGYKKPTPIQAYLIPRALEGRDVLGQAQTGTGKTAAFLVPFFNRWQPVRGGPQALVLAPTRELATQIADEAVRLSPTDKIKSVCIYGGQRIGGQTRQMQGGFDIAIGTPGRILDHLGRGSLNFDAVKYVVLDEADRMLDIGFRPDIERILRRVPRQRQTLLMSATLPPDVLKLAVRYMIKPLHINLAPKRITVEKIRQRYITVDKERKFDALVRVLEMEEPKQCIIFCERKIWAHKLFEKLRHHSRSVAAMHGDLQQNEREAIMRRFKDGSLHLLVATDVVGRGIDVTGITHIINYDLPEDPENYVHRIGRTGRIGKDGVAIAFVTREQGEQLTKIEQFINKQIESFEIEGFEAVAPKLPTSEEQPKPYTPVFGRRTKKHSKRL
jgi:ATP-dependent RNA helicase DeaD